ncbi:site-specific integrase [Cupriavidus basilensis]|uniref:site-specific integrase n=1 Tax=Cupriavidus basilensis TaxID=68895 RepID=UPI0020A660E4|nr:site-specific integrase [Cupriavidus basilensis]MCP3022776.1 site-specific integrase [Cupriavidus basilensis]
MEVGAEKHFWSKTTLTLKCVRGRTGEECFPKVHINLKETGLKRGGLLEEVISAAECPIAYTRAGNLRRLFKKAAEMDMNIIHILNTPTSRLTQHDIQALISKLDTVLDSYDTLRGKSNYIGSVKHFLKQCRVPLSDGEIIESTSLYSRHKDWSKLSSSDPKHLVEISDVFAENLLTAPLSAIEFETLEERSQKALSKLEFDLNKIVRICADILDRHESLAAKLAELAKQSLPEILPKKSARSILRGGRIHGAMVEQLSPIEWLNVVAHSVEARKIYLHRGGARSLPFLNKLREYWSLPNCSLDENYSMILSSRYLPRPVVLACLIIIAKRSGWNHGTVISLKKSDVTENNDGGYTICALKPKTNEIQCANISDPICIKALRMLLFHREEIDKNFQPRSKSIFISLRHRAGNRDEYAFSVGKLSDYLPKFCRLTGLPKFRFDDLRGAAAHVKYLSTNRDIFQTQEFLGHTSVETTSIYIQTTLIRLLGEANILRFVTLLNDCILYSTGRTDRLTPTQIARVKKNNLLLFPPSALDDNGVQCIADRWVASLGHTPFMIGRAEVSHVALQHRFYTEHMQALLQENHERFVAYHLPRIVFCSALRLAIAAGPLASTLKKYEALYAHTA